MKGRSGDPSVSASLGGAMDGRSAAWFGSIVQPLSSTLRVVSQDRLAYAGAVILLLFVLVALFARVISPYDASETVRNADGSLNRLAPPSSHHWFGTSYFGRDVLSEVLVGTRTSLIVGIVAAVAVGLVSTALGLVAGYFGGWLDDIITRVVDVVLSIPTVPFAIVVVAIVGPSLESIILVIIALYWRNGVRVIRSAVLAEKEKTYVTAAKAAGASHGHLILFHVLPNVLPVVFLWTTITVAFSILTEATLSFLGLGDPDSVSWGQILNSAFKTGTVTSAWWTVLFPSLFLVLLVSSLYFIGRAYEESANPRLRQEMQLRGARKRETEPAGEAPA